MTPISRLRGLAALPLVTIIALTSCSAGADASASASSTPFTLAAHTVTTDQGEVAVPADPQTIVVLNYALAGYLYDMDVPVAATISEDTAVAGAYSDFWAEDAEADGTQFVSWSNDGFDLEAILALQPDLIIGGGIGFPLYLATQAYADLSAIAPTVLVSGTLDDWQEQYDFLANDVFERGEVYDEALAAYDARVAEVKESITPPPTPAAFLSLTADQTAYVLIEDRGLPQVFASVGIEPAELYATGQYEPYTSGGDSFELSTEQVGQVLTQPTLFVTGFNGADVDVATLEQNSVWASLPAFQSGNAYDLPYWVYRGDYDETMALLDLIEEMFG
ncbi:MAG: ABC transporter substrate-binding protein [Microbacterium sp.]|uniref:ABC transporter substrate-binding protein n=1 Tax=Microbacterium sp. TaxID=51671 RepID=UPI0039E4EDD2